MATLRIDHPELFGVTEARATLHFDVVGDDGPVDAPARVLLDGELRATVEGGPGTRTVVLEGLAPGTSHRVEIV
ncbi:MAG TPA: hypothetical protein VKB65_06150, partial [Myxococcota bacterium]|nr:hypothetical protein [Myxococcota bacterium]